MLSQIRSLAKSPVAKILLAVVMVSFLVLGIRGIAPNVSLNDEVVKAGGRPAITSQGFKDRFTFFKTQVEQQNQQEISVQDAVAHDLDRRVADELAFSESFADMLVRDGVKPADQLIVDKLRTIPRFFNQISGQFDKTAYTQFLQQNNMTAVQAEGELRDEIAERQFVTGMAAGLRAPLIYPAMQAAYIKEGRTFQFFPVSPAVLGQPVKPTDAQLNAFIKQNAAQLMKPEMRQLGVVHFSAATLAPTLAASDAEVQKRFNFEKDTLSAPEKRTFVQIPVKDPKTADAIAAKLRSGADPQALAQANGVQAVTYTDQPKGGVPDKGVADAAFALKAGETSGAVHGDLGLAVIRVFSVTPAHDATLAEARPKIEAEVKKAASEEQIYQLVQKYDDAHAGGADMAAAAKAAGQTVAVLGPITAKGQDLEGHSAGLPPKVLQAAFSQPQGGDTDPIDLGQGEYYVVHVNKVLAPAVPTLDEIRPKLTQYFMLRDMASKLQAKAQALSAAVSKGESMSDAAKSVGAAVSEANGVLRNGAGQTYSNDLIGRLFAAKVGDVVVGEDTKLGFVVAKLEKVDAADPASLAPVIVAERDQVTKGLFDDLGQATRNAARALVKPHVDYAKARAALGVDPSQPSAVLSTASKSALAK